MVDLDRAGDLHDRLLKEAVQLHRLGGKLPKIDGDANVAAKLFRQFRGRAFFAMIQERSKADLVPPRSRQPLSRPARVH